MSPEQRLVVVLEPVQLAAMKAIELKTGARISEQIRRAIERYLETQSYLDKAELRKLRRR